MRIEGQDAHENDLPDELAAPSRRALVASAYTRLEQLAQVSEAEILALHGVGTKAIN